MLFHRSLLFVVSLGAFTGLSLGGSYADCVVAVDKLPDDIPTIPLPATFSSGSSRDPNVYILPKTGRYDTCTAAVKLGPTPLRDEGSWAKIKRAFSELNEELWDKTEMERKTGGIVRIHTPAGAQRKIRLELAVNLGPVPPGQNGRNVTAATTTTPPAGSRAAVALA